MGQTLWLSPASFRNGGCVPTRESHREDQVVNALQAVPTIGFLGAIDSSPLSKPCTFFDILRFDQDRFESGTPLDCYHSRYGGDDDIQPWNLSNDWFKTAAKKEYKDHWQSLTICHPESPVLPIRRIPVEVLYRRYDGGMYTDSRYVLF